MSSGIWKNRSFVFVWLGNGVSELGGAFGTFCNSILIYQLTNSTMALGSMWLLYFLPSLILQLFIGPFVDRWSRKWIMIFSQWARGLIFLIPLVALLMGNLETWHIYAVQIIVGLITPIYTPANQAITPTIVCKEQLSTANAYIDGTVRLVTFLAPILGGFVVEYIGVIPTLIFVSVVLITSGTLLLLIKETKVTTDVRKIWIEQFIEGISYFFKHPIIVWLGVFLAFVQFGVGVTMVITLPYITEELSGSYSEYGYFMAGFPLGYVVGSILVGKVTYKSRRVVMLGALVVGGLTFISLSINHSIILAILTEIIAGAAMAFFSVQNITIIQQTVPNNLMGKVSSVRLFIIRGAMPLGVFVGSFFAEIWGIRTLYLMIGSIICATALLGIFLPYFKFIDSNIDENMAS
ncbi:MAG: MFS transporter [Bacillota bacterium]|uniref:Permease n=1 Tax=Cytobacillus oceanisediminis 2691 TaxID=1196031 RepID=A0A160MI60_9BACI|nr:MULTISPECIES: MFS transporter [Cytobacillus]AND43217.1 permease [Cytobacillus oceanisediminis 2691]MCM3245686.1 MFS transporter [Cytobacillus oceanisediminis]UQX56989.1 MFS transporter [Cytobacillus pseudoceanisediminis]USK47383.1 MFS transporter [Cytobacillus oceanisediminis]